MHIELETERLKLRQWREADVDPLLRFYRDPASAAVFGDGVARHDVWRRVASFIGHWELRGFGLWALEDKRSGDFVGYGGLWYPSEFADVEVGWGLMPLHRGRGYAAEAARRALLYGYGDMGLERLVSYIEPTNAASIRLAIRLGARPDGEFSLRERPHVIYLHGKPAAAGREYSAKENDPCH
jgi:RimJ/RimL family protein N-acetyltransferase